MSSAESPRERWVLARSDRFLISVDQPNKAYVIGRKHALPLAQQLAGKYASREQLAVEWRPPALFITQLGKNPTFFGKECQQLPRRQEAPVSADASSASASTEEPSGLKFIADETIDSAKVTPAASTHAPQSVVVVPHTPPAEVAVFPERSHIDAATLFFPEEVFLPSISVRFESAGPQQIDNAATSSFSVAQMLAVPSAAVLEDEERAEGEAKTEDRGADEEAEREAKPGWQGLLDVALVQREQQQQQQQQVQQSHDGVRAVPPPSPPATPQATAAPAAAPAKIPFGSYDRVKKSETATTPLDKPEARAAHAPPPSPPEEVQMGLWEWKCHANGKDADPKSWRRYPKAVADLLERAYRAREVVVTIPDALLSGRTSSSAADKSNAKSTYSVCFAEASLDGAMVQLQNKDKSKFRLVHRRGGGYVCRDGVKPINILPSSSSESDDDSFIDGDDDDNDDSSSSEESFTSSDSSSDAPKKRRRRS